MLNASEDGEGHQPSVLRWRLQQLRVRLGYGMCCLRGARAVVEGDEFTRDPSNMIFAQEDEVIQGGLTKCPVETLNVGIRVWCVIGSWQPLDLQHLIEPKIEVAAIVFAFRALLWMSELPKESVVVCALQRRTVSAGRNPARRTVAPAGSPRSGP